MCYKNRTYSKHGKQAAAEPEDIAKYYGTIKTTNKKCTATSERNNFALHVYFCFVNKEMMFSCLFTVTMVT